jgi:hypothetical protein
MSYLKPGTLCITLKRRDPRNAGRIVRVIRYVGNVPPDAFDGYEIETVDGRPFAALIVRDERGRPRMNPKPGPRCRASRAYLIPLMDPDIEVDGVTGADISKAADKPLGADLASIAGENKEEELV